MASEETTVRADAGDPEDAGGDRLLDTLSSLGEAAEETLRTLHDGFEGAEDKVRDGLEKAEDTIREHPLVAIGLAAGLGFVLGLLMRGDRE